MVCHLSVQFVCMIPAFFADYVVVLHLGGLWPGLSSRTVFALYVWQLRCHPSGGCVVAAYSVLVWVCLLARELLLDIS